MSRVKLAWAMPWRENVGWNPTSLRKRSTFCVQNYTKYKKQRHKQHISCFFITLFNINQRSYKTFVEQNGNHQQPLLPASQSVNFPNSIHVPLLRRDVHKMAPKEVKEYSGIEYKVYYNARYYCKNCSGMPNFEKHKR